jgi:hypothetical protein
LKINKKIAASSIATLMAISPVISLAQNPTRTVQPLLIQIKKLCY